MKTKGRRPGIKFRITKDGLVREEKLHRGKNRTLLKWDWMSSITTEDTYRKFRRIVGVLGAIFVLAGVALMTSSFAGATLTDSSTLVLPLSGVGLVLLGIGFVKYSRPKVEWQIHMDVPHSAEEDLFRGYGKDFADEVEDWIKGRKPS